MQDSAKSTSSSLSPLTDNHGLSYIVCTYKRPALMRNFLDSFVTMLPQDGLWELIVIDNAGDAQTREMTREVASKFGSQFRYVHEGNTGLCYARNRGLVESRFDFVCLLDDDVTFDTGFGAESLRAVSESDADVVIPRIVSPVVDEWPEWLKTRVSSGVGQYEAGPTRVELQCDGKLPVGAAVIYRKALHEEFGLFATNLDRMGKKLFGGGETAFFKKARQGGARMIYEPRIRVDHHLTQEKWTKSYWRRQGFYGGRSFVRMESMFGTLRAGYFVESVAKTLYWGARAALLPKHRFKAQYHMLAHLGRCFEIISLLAMPRRRDQEA